MESDGGVYLTAHISCLFFLFLFFLNILVLCHFLRTLIFFNGVVPVPSIHCRAKAGRSHAEHRILFPFGSWSQPTTYVSIADGALRTLLLHVHVLLFVVRSPHPHRYILYVVLLLCHHSTK